MQQKNNAICNWVSKGDRKMKSLKVKQFPYWHMKPETNNNSVSNIVKTVSSYIIIALTRDDSMKDRTSISKSRSPSTELLEVFCSLGDNAAVQSHFDPTRRFTTDTDIEVYRVGNLGICFTEKTLKHTPNLERGRTDMRLLRHRLGREGCTHRGIRKKRE